MFSPRGFLTLKVASAFLLQLLVSRILSAFKIPLTLRATMNFVKQVLIIYPLLTLFSLFTNH